MKTTTADPSPASHRPDTGSQSTAVTATVRAPTATTPISRITTATTERSIRTTTPARRRYGTAAMWFSVRSAEYTTPVAVNTRPITPTAKAIRDVGRVASESSTVDSRPAGTIASTSRARRSAFATSTRDRNATPSSSNGNTLRKP